MSSITLPCFLQGLAIGRVSYDARERDVNVETKCACALALLENIVAQLGALDDSGLDDVLSIGVEGARGGVSPCRASSTVARELDFLLSHTIHHYGLISLILRIQGVDPGEDFGVAPSTLRHLQESRECAR